MWAVVRQAAGRSEVGAKSGFSEMNFSIQRWAFPLTHLSHCENQENTSDRATMENPKPCNEPKEDKDSWDTSTEQ